MDRQKGDPSKTKGARACPLPRHGTDSLILQAAMRLSWPVTALIFPSPAPHAASCSCPWSSCACSSNLRLRSRTSCASTTPTAIRPFTISMSRPSSTCGTISGTASRICWTHSIPTCASRRIRHLTAGARSRAPTCRHRRIYIRRRGHGFNSRPRYKKTNH